MQRQPIADATICCDWRQPGTPADTYRPEGPASHVFPETEREPILAAPPTSPDHWRMIARAPARLHGCIDGDFKLMHYPSGQGFCIPVRPR